MGPHDYPDYHLIEIPINGFLMAALSDFFTVMHAPEPVLSDNVVQFPKRGKFAE